MTSFREVSISGTECSEGSIMKWPTGAPGTLAAVLSSVLVAMLLQGCASTEQSVALGAAVATLVGAQSPTHEIQQTYYFGVFDPQDQLPPQMYRIRVHGQASFISSMKFASGWVPAQLVDSLNTTIRFDKNGRAGVSQADASQLSGLGEGRRLLLFGPQGFREAPRDHRLVIVMGSSPEGFFSAIDKTVGKMSEAIEERRNTRLMQKLFRALVIAKADRERLSELRRDLEATKGQGGAS